jgi:asparagine synthase (glutamine-hydrolysing)
MCGIVGIQQKDASSAPDETVLRAATATLTHRGPDDQGLEFLGSTALGFRRLSIIDLATGHQPLGNEDGRVWSVLNGEIYNFRELREELTARGHTFTTSADSEVVVHGWEEWGAKLPERLLGMFALAVCDRRDGTLFLARDRMGQKPLYYAETADAFVFASELKALRCHPAVSSRIDRRALRKYLAYEMVPYPHTILERVRKLPPGTRLLVRDGRIVSLGRYHDLHYSPKHEFDDDAARAGLWEHLVRSVESQLVADVPVGIFLSGGVDSSALLAAAAEVGAASQLATFSIGMEDPTFDEAPYAARVAQHFGTEHHTQQFTASEVRDTIAELPRLLDEPLGDASLLPTFLLSRFARGSVKVALGGDGGDEILAGYDTFDAHRIARRYQRLVPQLVERFAVAPLVRALPVSSANMSFGFRARQFLRGVRMPPAMRSFGWMGSLHAHEQCEFLVDAPANDSELFSEMLELDTAGAAEADLDREIHGLTRTYLAEDILTKVDRASMATSLEVRSPFLDHRLVDWVARLPADMKMRGREKKWLLRSALRGRLPDDILDRPKKGFGVPLSAWLRNELHDWAAATLDGLAEDLGEVVHVAPARRMLAEHRAGAADHRKPLWTLLCLAVWVRAQHDGVGAVS